MTERSFGWENLLLRGTLAVMIVTVLLVGVVQQLQI